MGTVCEERLPAGGRAESLPPAWHDPDVHTRPSRATSCCVRATGAEHSSASGMQPRGWQCGERCGLGGGGMERTCVAASRREHIRRVVARALDAAHTPGRRSVKLLDDEGVNRLEPALVISTYGRRDDAEGVVGRGTEAELLAVAEKEWSQVHRAAVAVGRDVVHVVADDSVHGLVKELGRDHRHRQSLRAALQPGGVGLGTRVKRAVRPSGRPWRRCAASGEVPPNATASHLAVLAVKSLEALEKSLAIVEDV
eukprot:scaffold33786_cov124-Isochrysis_galbana.AAC.7